MVEVTANPRLTGFASLAAGRRLPVGDYPEGRADGPGGAAVSVRALYDLEGAWPPPGGRGLARYGALLPYVRFPSLGEGGTPLVDLPALAEACGVRALGAKMESQNPTGSHKDRMSPLAVARAFALGHGRVAAASSGNAGVSLAAYAARAGLACTIVTTAGTPESWLRAIERLGAELVTVPTSRDRWALMAEKARSGDWFPVTNYVVPPVGSNAFGVQGYKTVAYEIAEDRGALPPDAIVVPTSRGDLVWGLYEGFRELRGLGVVDRIPRLFAVEPFARLEAVLEGRDLTGVFPGETGLLSIAGDTVTYQAIEAVRETAGGAAAVTTEQAVEAANALGRRGLLVEESSAAALAGLQHLVARGRLGPEDDVVLVLTSHGFKTGLTP